MKFTVVILLVFVCPFLYPITSKLETNQYKDIQEILEDLKKTKLQTNFFVSDTNILFPVDYSEITSLKVSFDADKLFKVEEKPFFMDYGRRYEIILLVSIPTTYMVTKFLMEQISFYNYRDYSRTLNTQQWAYIIASSIIIPLVVSTEDYLKYKKYIEEKLRF